MLSQHCRWECERRGIRKNIVAICVGIWSVSTALVGFTHNLTQLFSMRSIWVSAKQAMLQRRRSHCWRLFAKSKRGTYLLPYWSVGTLVGAAIGVTLGGHVADARAGAGHSTLLVSPALSQHSRAGASLSHDAGHSIERTATRQTAEMMGMATWERFPQFGTTIAENPNLLDHCGGARL